MTHRTATLLLLLALLAAGVHANGIRYYEPEPGPYHALPDEVVPQNILKMEHPALLTSQSKFVRDTTVIDFEKRQIAFMKIADYGIVVWQYRYYELDDYLAGRGRFALLNQWFRTHNTSRGQAQERGRKRLSLELRLPEQYYNQAIPPWAQRIVGKEPPKLSIHGYEEILISYRSSKYDAPSNVRQSPGSPSFDQNYNLTVAGSVGKLINIQMGWSKEQGFDAPDPLKAIKIEYKGEGNELEDDIIQEVKLGYTNFEIPSTSLSGYSESREGLFGVNVKSKFGPLMLTTVASHEKGEALKTTFHPQQSSSNGLTFSEKDFMEYRYVFLDTLYKQAYIASKMGSPPPAVAPPPVSRFDVQVWKMVPGNTSLETIRSDISTKYRAVKNRLNKEVFKLIKDGYTVEPGGWIRFVDSTIQDADNDVIGISMKLRYASGDSIVRGDTLTINGPVNGVDTIADLWIIKDKSTEFDSTNAEWDLWWRNVYRLPKFDGDFNIRLGRIPEGDKDTLYRLSTTLFTQILGLTDANGKRNTATDIFDVDNGALIVPPFANDPTGNEPFRNTALGADNTQSAIYRIRKSQTNQEKVLPKFQFTLDGKFTTRTTTFNLGWGVLEKSEKVKADGRELVRDVDYRMYYESGDLEILSFEAQSASDITVEYQRESLFMPESKSFLGARGEIRLPFISPTSFVGSSVLYQSVNTNSDVPKIGQEPFNKLLLDVNTKLDWDSDWMTKMVDALPFIETEASSKVTIDIEAAHSVMKRKNKLGKASVDDFESSVRTYPLSTSPRSWALPSPPAEFLVGPDSLMPTHPPAWRYFWYSPLDPVKQTDKERAENYKTNMFSGIAIDTKKDDNLLEPVLNLTVLPSGPKTKDRYVDPWAGITYWFPTSSADRTDDRFLEFLVNLNAAQPGGTQGRLHVDMGEVSEDLAIQGGNPNGRCDAENPLGLPVDDSLNRGLDGIRDGDIDPVTKLGREFTWMPTPGATGWKQIGPGSGSSALNDLLWDPADPSGDDYKLYDTRNDGDFTKVNGLENDYTGKLRLLTSEDINGNGFSTRNAYFRFNIDLDSLQPTSNYRYQVTESNVRADKGWYHVRIPLSAKAADAIVDPARASFERVYFVRLWWDGFSDTATIDKQRNLMLARMQFVGNQWEEVATRSMVSKMVGTWPPVNSTQPLVYFYRDSVMQTYGIDTNRVAVSGISTEDNAVYAAAMAPNGNPELDTVGMLGIKRQRETNSTVYKKESALLFKYTNVKPNENALIRRRYPYQALDISAYSQVSVLVRSEVDHRYDGTSFVLRFGTDDSSYYEYRTPLQAGWSKLRWTRPIEVDLAELSHLKLRVLDSLEQEKVDKHILPDTAHIVARQEVGSSGAYYGMKCRGGAMPSYNNIRMVLMGIERDGGGVEPISGELWINEMQVEGLSDISGSAALASVRTQWADFMSLDATADYRDGNFRQMTESQITPGASRISGTAHGAWNLDKFTPKELGIQVPLNLTLTEAIERPQLRPNSDISLTGTDREPDKLRDFAPNAQTDSKNYEKVATSVGINTRYSKTRESENPIVRLTADRFSVADLGFKKSANTESQGSAKVLKSDTTRTVTTSLKYDLSPRKTPTWTKWQPFGKVKAPWFPSEIKRYELTYLPKTISFDLVDANYQRTLQRNDRLNPGNPIDTRTLGMNHGFRFAYSPISPLLDLGYNVSARRDLDNAIDSTQVGFKRSAGVVKRVFDLDTTWRAYGYLWGEQSRTQNMSMDLRPNFFSWLTNTVHYEAAFGSNQTTWQRVPALSINVKSDFKITSSIRLSSLLQDIGKAVKNAKGLNASMTKMQKGLTTIGLDNVSFDYTASATTRYANVTDTLLNRRDVNLAQYDAYQFGVGGRSLRDIMMAEWDPMVFGGMQYRKSATLNTGDNLSGQRSLNFSTSFRIPDPVSLNFSRLSFGHDFNYNATANPGIGDTTIVSPKIGISLSSNILNQIGPVKDNVQDVSLSSGYTFDKRLTYKHTSALRDKSMTKTHTLAPLIRVGGTLKKWPVNISYSHNYSNAETKTNQGRNRSRSHGDEASLGYAFNPSAKKPRELKLFGYSIPLKGELRLDLAFTHSFKTDETRGRPVDRPTDPVGWQPSSKSRSIGIDPKISYDFTDNVTGNVIYSFSWVKNEVPANSKETTNVFTLSVRISF